MNEPEIHLIPLGNAHIREITKCEWIITRKIGNNVEIVGLFRNYEDARNMEAILGKEYFTFSKKDFHKRLCNYFKCSDSNDKQYPECEEQTTGRCQAIGVICALCKKV